MRAEEVHKCEELQHLIPERLGPLQVVHINSLENPGGVVEISFACVSPSINSDIKLTATCFSYHTFLVMEKG